jgi:serine protease Do
VSTGLFLTTRRLEETTAVRPSSEVIEPSGGDAVAQAEPSLRESRRTAIVEAAERVGPATVSISVVQTRIVRQTPFAGGEFFERFFRGSFPERQYEQRYHSFGSGVVIDPDGYILTNDHVVRGSTEIRVTLTDGREFDARFLGGDPRFDLAVLKIDGDALPVAPLGDSDDLLIGEWCVAIGNPFGYLLNDPSPSVSAGVVSAVHRDIVSESETGAVYKDMIQTDAAINPGNSGGPLVNSRGEVIGISSFIFTSSGGSQGMGFAIPINVAKLIINEMIEYGSVRDVWVGIRVQDITPVLAERLGLSMSAGVLASYVEADSPADRAGIRTGDIVVGVNGDAVENIREARRAIFGARVGDIITLNVLRGGERRDFDVKLEEVPR